MEQTTLSGPEFTPISGNKPRHLLIMLHGYGANGADLISLAPLLAQMLPDTHFISPNAPFPCEMAPAGYQWFSLRDWSPTTMLRGAHEVAPVLDLFINAQLERFHLRDDQFALLGFSQGTMLALYTALRRSKPCAAIAGFSGSLIGEEGIISKPPVCLIHGDNDNVVPHGAMVLAEAALKHEGVKVEAHTRPGLGHGIDMEGLNLASNFLKDHLR
jgi:phospholipase/carboxylesterase